VSGSAETIETAVRGVTIMAEHGAAKTNAEKNIERGAAQIKDTSERLSATTEHTFKMVESSFASAANAIKDYNLKACEFAQANWQSTFDDAKRLASAKSPQEMLEVWTTCVSRQFETLIEQARELAMLGQRVATDSAEPLSRRIH
jgi:phasin